MHRGYVKVWRKVKDSGILQDGPMCQVFLKALLDSAHTEMTRRVGRQVVELQPGEFIFGRNQWAEDLGLSPKVVRGRIKKLERNGVIWATQRANEYTLFSFANWVSYQSSTKDEGPTTGPTKGQPGANQGPHLKNSNIQTLEEEEKEKNIVDESSASSTTPPANNEPTSDQLLEEFANPKIKDLVSQAIEQIHLTRKSGKAAESVIARFIRSLRQYEDWKVGTGLTRYIEGEYYLDGKAERYALGIVRNVTAKDYQDVLDQHKAERTDAAPRDPPRPDISPRTYAQAKDAERRQRAMRLRQAREGQEDGTEEDDQTGVGPAGNLLPLSGAGGG